LDLDRTTINAGLKIKMVRDAVREMARHDMNDSRWTVDLLGRSDEHLANSRGVGKRNLRTLTLLKSRYNWPECAVA